MLLRPIMWTAGRKGEEIGSRVVGGKSRKHLEDGTAAVQRRYSNRGLEEKK